MVPNPLSTKDEEVKPAKLEAEKPAKLEAETSHQTSATLEGQMMPPDRESIKDSDINSQPLDPPDAYDRLPSLIKVRS